MIIFFKALLLCVFGILFRGTLPRYRFDQLIQFTWKHFIFLWVFFLVLSSFYFTLFLNF